MLFFIIGIPVFFFAAYLTGVTSVSITPRCKNHRRNSSISLRTKKPASKIQETTSESEEQKKKKPVTRSEKALAPFRDRIGKLEAIEREKNSKPETKGFSNFSDSVIILSSSVIDVIASISVGLILFMLTYNTASQYNIWKAGVIAFNVLLRGEDSLVWADWGATFWIGVFSLAYAAIFYVIRTRVIIKVTQDYIEKYLALGKRPNVKEQASCLEIAVYTVRRFAKRVIWAAREVSKEQKVSRAEPKCA